MNKMILACSFLIVNFASTMGQLPQTPTSERTPKQPDAPSRSCVLPVIATRGPVPTTLQSRFEAVKFAQRARVSVNPH